MTGRDEQGEAKRAEWRRLRRRHRLRTAGPGRSRGRLTGTVHPAADRRRPLPFALASGQAADGWRGNRLVFSAGDSGTALWTAVTPEQEAELLSRLDALGIPPTALAARPARGR